jgi:signal transduction histidine kinase
MSITGAWPVNDGEISHLESRTIILTPTGRDSRLIAGLLERLSLSSHVADSVEEAAALIEEGAGAAIISEEAFLGVSFEPLLTALDHQPSWSDFPVILLTVSGRVTAQSERLRELRSPLGNVFLLERPIRPETLLGTLEIALRGRKRQYQIRDQMEKYALAQSALLRTEKLAITGRLAASIAHEINNPLAAVTNLLYLMQGDLTPEQQKEFVKQAQEEVARVAEITKQTLRFYREPSERIDTDLAPVLDSVLRLYGSRLSSAGISVQRELTCDTAVRSTQGELRQVLANLIGNAVDAMRFGGRLRIRVSENRHLDADRSYVRVTIGDTGTGIPANVLPAIFEPFVTTKSETGTGLGLWVIGEILKKSAWTIRVRSSQKAAHCGTVFSILIPKVPSPALVSA